MRKVRGWQGSRNIIIFIMTQTIMVCVLFFIPVVFGFCIIIMRKLEKNPETRRGNLCVIANKLSVARVFSKSERGIHEGAKLGIRARNA